jgi:molybdopterin/thiamine biosynthesis adenylyltransferase
VTTSTDIKSKSHIQNHKELSDAQLLRYSRHIMLPSMDIDGQTALWNARVLVIGVGGLGCSAAQYLVAAGLGQVTLVDDDVVELNNLQRQVLHTEGRVGVAKTESAKLALSQINSDVSITSITQRLDDAALLNTIAQHDIVLDCTDNLNSRQGVNAACFATKTPLVSGAAIRFEGQVSTYTMQPDTACYACVVLSPIVGMVGCIQAAEAIKTIASIGEVLSGKLLMIDGLSMTFNTLNIQPDLACRVCRHLK